LQDITILEQVLKRYETYYILLHIVGICVFHTLNVGVIGAPAGVQALLVLTFATVGYGIVFDSIPHVPLFIKTRVFLLFPTLGTGVLFVLNLVQNMFRSAANTYVPAALARFGQSCVSTVVLFFGKFIFLMVCGLFKQRRDGNQWTNLISIGVRVKMAKAESMSQSAREDEDPAAVPRGESPSVHELHALQIELEPVLEDAMSAGAARAALERIGRKNLVLTQGSAVLPQDKHAAALNVRELGSFPSKSKPNPRAYAWEEEAWQGRGQAANNHKRLSEMAPQSGEAAELLGMCRELSTSFAVCFPFRPVNNLALAKRISVQRWYFVLCGFVFVLSVVMGTSVVKNTVASIFVSSIGVFIFVVELSRFDRSLVWHLFFKFEVLIFMFSTYSFSIWNMVNNANFPQLEITTISNNINYIMFYTIGLLMDGATMYPLWFRRAIVCLVVLNMIAQLAFKLIRKDEFLKELCVNASLCVSPGEIAFYRCVRDALNIILVGRYGS
jgi:hypothetical protein